MEQRAKDRLFVLRMMNFIFKVKSVVIPHDLNDMLEEYPADEPSYFTPHLTEATLILMEIEESRRNYTEIDDLFFYSTETYHLMNNFNCPDFFKFCVRYGTQSVSDYLAGKMNAPSIVYKTIVRIIVTCRNAGMFDAGTWIELDEHAQLVIARSRGGNVREAEIESSSETEEERLQDRLSAESEFVLEVMKHVFNLHFKELPRSLQTMLDEYSENPHPYFSPTVVAAIKAELNLEVGIIRNLREQDLEDYYERQLLENFNVKTFLEACVCFSKKAIREYYEEYRSESPRSIHGFLAMQLGTAREENKFTTWVDMEQAAIDTIAEFDGKLSSDRENELLSSFGEDALHYFANTESASDPIPLRCTSPEVGCPSCKCN